MQGLSISLAIHVALVFAVMVRVILRPHRQPSSRLAWIVVVATMPALGVVAYLLLGETNIGRRRIARMRRVLEDLPERSAPLEQSEVVRDPYRHLFKVAESISGFAPVGGNSAHLLPDSNATIDSMVSDIDEARDHVHLLFYIWLADNNGRKIIEALKRAAARGVKCRAMADALGSRALIESPHWKDMAEAGVRLGVALPLNHPLLRIFVGRIDLRNHRKIVVIDGRITYCGSQNCADPEFLVKAKFAPWVDAVMRFEGPIANQNQYVFASDWMTYVDENIDELLAQPTPSPAGNIPASVVASGPTVRFSAMPEMFISMMYAAREQLLITSPYYVPNEPLQSAICAAAYRGVETTIIFPARNDSWIVAAASRSCYAELLESGVKIYEYPLGLLHTKSLTIDGEVALIGSANMDRRSFDLNYENNILLVDREVTGQFRERQLEYLKDSEQVTADDVAAWSLSHRLLNNTIAMLGPVL